MNKTQKFSPEVRERAVRMVQDARGEYPSLWATIESIAPTTERLCALAERYAGGRVLAMGGGGYNLRNVAETWAAVVEALGQQT